MDYNTSREKLQLPEYGRNIQKMVNHIKTVEDRDKRNQLAKALIDIMGSMNPHLRDVADFKHKLWDHLAIISDFELDVDSPFDQPSREEIFQKPDPMPYKQNRNIRFKHYGRVIQDMIKAAIDYEDPEGKEQLIIVICNQMKKSYILWNRESISDEVIFGDLATLSEGLLRIPEGLRLKDHKDLVPPPSNTRTNTQRKQNNPQNKRKKTYRR